MADKVKGWMMRALTWIVLIVGVLYCGYWFVAARQAETATLQALAEAEARGLEVRHQGLSIAGFPNRFDLTLTEPDIYHMQSGTGWRAPFLQVFALSYAPWNLIAALPNEQVLSLQGQSVTVNSTRMQASLFLRPRPSLPVRDVKWVAEGASLRSDAGWSMGFASANLSLVGTEPGAEVAFRVLDLVPDQQISVQLSSAGLPAAIGRIDALADLTLDRPVTLREAPPAMQAIALREAHIDWGPVKVTGKGEVHADALGFAEGTIELRIAGWRTAYDAARAAGLLPERMAIAVGSVLEHLASRSGEPDLIDLPLVMQQGRMMLGPMPLGPAPRLR